MLASNQQIIRVAQSFESVNIQPGQQTACHSLPETIKDATKPLLGGNLPWFPRKQPLRQHFMWLVHSFFLLLSFKAKIWKKKEEN